MPIRFEAGLTDDNDFVVVVRAIMDGVVTQQAPHHVWVVQVDNWFDHKWLGFPWNGRVANPNYAGPGDIPPFSPNRILSQWSFTRADGDYLEFPLRDAPHRWDKERSSGNLNRIAVRDNNTCFFWYSGNTLKNDRGSLMTYLSQGGEVVCWYAEFIRHEKWRLGRTKGINRREMSGFAGGRLEEMHD
jgi:hypothetical protein